MAGERNVIVPIWHDVGAEAVRAYSPALADLVAARSSEGVVAIPDRIEQVLRSLEDAVRQGDRVPAADPATQQEATVRTTSSSPVAVRELEYLNEDMRRWIRDRDRVLQSALARTSEEMNARGVFHSSIHLATLAEIRHQALH